MRPAHSKQREWFKGLKAPFKNVIRQQRWKIVRQSFSPPCQILPHHYENSRFSLYLKACHGIRFSHPCYWQRILPDALWVDELAAAAVCSASARVDLKDKNGMV